MIHALDSAGAETVTVHRRARQAVAITGCFASSVGSKQEGGQTLQLGSRDAETNDSVARGTFPSAQAFDDQAFPSREALRAGRSCRLLKSSDCRCL